MTDLLLPRASSCPTCATHGPEISALQQDLLAFHRAWHDMFWALIPQQFLIPVIEWLSRKADR